MSRIVDALQTFVPATVGGTGTTAKIFQYSASAFTPTDLTAPGAVTLPIPGSGRLNGKRFTIAASGNATVAGSSPTLQIQLLASVNGAANVIVAQSSAQSVSGSFPWTIAGVLQGDTLSGIVQGSFSALVNSLLNSPAVLTNGLTGVSFGTNSASGATNGASYPTTGVSGFANPGLEPPIKFQVALVFGVSNAANVGRLMEFFAFEEN